MQNQNIEQTTQESQTKRRKNGINLPALAFIGRGWV
jgi:hypothetical protein